MSLASRLFSGFAKPLLTRFLSDRIILYPNGDFTSPVLVLALVSLDTELGTNEVPGDGAVTRGVEGDRERRTGRIEIPVTVPQTDTLTPISPTIGKVYSVTLNGHTVTYTGTSTDPAVVTRGLVAAFGANVNLLTLTFLASDTNVTVIGGPGLVYTLTSSNLTHTTALTAGRQFSETDLWRIDGTIWTTQRQDATDTGPHAGYQSLRITTKLGRRTQHSLLKDVRPVPRG